MNIRINIQAILAMLLFLFLIFETSYFTLPFVFIICVTCYILYPDIKTLALIFLVTLTLDALKASSIGLSSLTVFISIFIFEVSKSAFEIKDYKIIITILFVATFVYANIFSYSNNLLLYIAVFAAAGIALHFYKKALW